MKKSVFFLFSAILISMLILCSHDKTKKFSGYIPVGFSPQLIWEANDYGSYELKGFIKVIIDNDTTLAQFEPVNGWQNSYCVRYKDTYPPCSNKVVYVKGRYYAKGIPFIRAASLEKSFIKE